MLYAHGMTLSPWLLPLVLLAQTSEDAGQSKQNQGAFPSDTPKVWEGTGRRFVELNFYGGPSWANSGGFGIGANLTVDDLRATEEGIGLNWEAAFGGGFYPGGSGHYGSDNAKQELQGQVVGGGAVAWGYYGIEGLKNGVSPHALLEFVALEVTVIGSIEQMYSYNPSIEVGVHGRNEDDDESWFFNVLGGAQVSYVTGDLEKLHDDGSVNHWLLAPAAAVEVTADQRLTDFLYMRFTGILNNTFDFLGPYGYRNIFQVIANAYLKLGPTVYTGPSFLYTDQQKTADPATKSYIDATAQYSISWLVGGTIAAF